LDFSELVTNLKTQHTKKMESQQMMELLLKEIRAGQGKADAMREEIRTHQTKAEAGHRELLAKLEDDRQADWKAWREEMAASHKETVAETKSEMDVEMIACQEMEALSEEKKPTSVDMKPEVAQKEQVPVQDATVMPVGEPKKKKRRRHWNLATERRGTPKERTQGKDWCRKTTGRRPQRDEPPCGSSTAEENRPEGVPSRNSDTTQERHLQAEHDPLCKSDTTQETRSSGKSRRTVSRTGTAEEADRRPICKRNSERMAAREETTGATAV
jgi:hypothetical protein